MQAIAASTVIKIVNLWTILVASTFVVTSVNISIIATINSTDALAKYIILKIHH